MTRHTMTQRIAIGAMLLGSLVATPVAADPITTSFDTVDEVEISVPGGATTGNQVRITGIVTGTTTPVTLNFGFNNSTTNQTGLLAHRCERLAVLAMSKPGKFRFLIGSAGNATPLSGGCRLVVRTP